MIATHTRSITRTRTSASLAFAAALGSALSWATLAMPVAHADPLSNGLDVTCGAVTDTHTTCVIAGCPRVHGDYVVDAVHVMSNGHQDEYDFKCIHGGTAIWNYQAAAPNTGFTIGVQGCRKKDLEGDWCGPWADYIYKPAAAAPKPADVPQPADATTPCPGGPPVPVGQTCPVIAPPPPPPVTDAIPPLTFNTGIGALTATVKNTSDLTAKCTYDASGLADTHRDFTVIPQGSTDLTFKGFNTGTSYHVVVSCHDATGKQPQVIGHQETDVTF